MMKCFIFLSETNCYIKQHFHQNVTALDCVNLCLCHSLLRKRLAIMGNGAEEFMFSHHPE